jgi:hypothetical protein
MKARPTLAEARMATVHTGSSVLFSSGMNIWYFSPLQQVKEEWI